DRSSKLRELLLILGAQARIRPEWPADKLTVRFLKSSYGAVSKTITRDAIARASLKLWRESVKTEDLINKVQVRYGRDWTKGHDDDEAFKKVTAPATDATSQTRYGVKEDERRFRFDFIDEDSSTMATDIRDFYKDRYKEPARMASITGYLDNVELLPGDLVGADLQVGPQLPPPVIFTFDDGYRSVFTEALPILRKYHFVGAAYLVTDYVGLENGWHDPALEPRVPLLTWEDVAALTAAGWEIGSHGRTHRSFTRLSPAE
ncbi:MAG: polysaccharide deacetylase family protein, partial [bacterium]